MRISVTMTPGILYYFSVLAFLFGAALGSFLNCAAWRTVHGESFLKGRSRCPECGHTLGALELVPIFSWLFLRGRCRRCKKPIPVRYLLVEVFFGLLTLACLLRFDLTLLCARNLIFLCCLFYLSLTDLENQTIPDGCLVIAALAWTVCAPFLCDSWADAGLRLLSGVVYGGCLLGVSLVMDKVMGRETLGGGDIKLFAVVGLYLGLIGTLFAVLLSCVFGLLFAAALKKQGRAFPFGPSIAAAATFMLLFGDGLVGWYLGLLGL